MASKTTAEVPGLGNFSLNTPTHHPFCPSADEKYSLIYFSHRFFSFRNVSAVVAHKEADNIRDPVTVAYYPLSPEALRAIDAIEYITEHLRRDEEYKMYRDDWKFVAMIIDRLLLYVRLFPSHQTDASGLLCRDTRGHPGDTAQCAECLPTDGSEEAARASDHHVQKGWLHRLDELLNGSL